MRPHRQQPQWHVLTCLMICRRGALRVASVPNMAADSVWSLYSAPASQAAAVMCLRALASHPCSVPLIVDSEGGIDALISLLYHDVLGEWACICLCLNGICYGSTPFFRIFINVLVSTHLGVTRRGLRQIGALYRCCIMMFSVSGLTFCCCKTRTLMHRCPCF